MNFLRSHSDMESGRIRTTPRYQHQNLEVNRNQIFARTPAMTKDMLNKLQNTELGPKHARLCGHEFNTRQISVLIALIFLFLLSSSTAFIFWYTELFKTTALQNMVISNTSETFKDFTNPAPTYVKIYIYNYTNTKAVATRNEAKLRVKELGPFTYEDKLSRINVKFSDDGNTVSYQEQRTYKFLPEKSKGRMQNDRVTVPNIPMLAGAAMFRRSYFLTRLGMSTLFKQLNAEPFLQVPADRFIMGYDDELFTLAKGMMALSKPYPFEQFGLLAVRQGISKDVIEVYTGKDDVNKVGTVKKLNGKSKMEQWINEDCDSVGGIDGYVFSPKVVQNKGKLEIFYKDMCRKMPIEFKEERKIFKGALPSYQYVVPENAYGHPTINNPANQGYCSMEGNCPPHGLMNVTKCAFGTPLFVSMPHFLGADPKLLEAVDGISKPKAELHQTYIDLHPIFGFIMQGWNRLQTNIQVQKSFGITELGMFEDDAILPVSWLEFGCSAEETPDYVLKLFYDATYLFNGIDLAFRFGSILMMAVTFMSICLVIRRNKINKVDAHDSMEHVS